MNLSLKKRIAGRKAYSAGKALAASLVMAAVIATLSVSVIMVFDSRQLRNADFWQTIIAHIIFFTWFFQMNFFFLRSFMTIKKKLLCIALLTLVSIPLLSLAVTGLQMLCYPASGFTFNGRMLMVTGSAFSDAIVTLSTCLLLYWRDSYNIKARENEKLNIENINNRFETLKKQLSPHFLFNSLNTLRGLISPDNDTARRYVDGMASVYRYTIQNREVVLFRDEMDFVRSYIYLLQTRYADALHVTIDCSPAYNDMLVLPVSVQSLVENAIKHNIVCTSAPLSVKIYTTHDAKVVVTNNLNPRETDDIRNTGTGLSNLFERYRLRFGADIEIDTSADSFTVSIPLFTSDNKTKQ